MQRIQSQELYSGGPEDGTNSEEMSSITYRLLLRASALSLGDISAKRNNHGKSRTILYNFWRGVFGAVLIGSTVPVLVNSSKDSTLAYCDIDEDCGVQYETTQVLTNWSETHSCSPERVYEPKSAQEVARLLQSFHIRNNRIRPVGTSLSPNGIGQSDKNLISLASLDYVHVNPIRKLVTVGAGARVSNVRNSFNVCHLLRC